MIAILGFSLVPMLYFLVFNGLRYSGAFELVIAPCSAQYPSFLKRVDHVDPLYLILPLLSSIEPSVFACVSLYGRCKQRLLSYLMDLVFGM